jgi:diguanylate cyclase (GGDEF)-like protein
MSDPLLSTFSRSGQSLFSVDEVRALMHIEFERAARYNYPICCLLIQVDRLSDTATYHGQEVKDEILGSIIELTRKETRAGDILGCLVDDSLLVTLPHTSPREVGYMLRRLLTGARELRFERGGRTQSITLSVGISNNQHPDARNFETLERVAEDGAAVAAAAGGDRYVETELYALHDMQVVQPKAAQIADSVETEDYRDRLEELMERDGNLEQAASKLAEEIMARAMREVAAAELAAPTSESQGLPDTKEIGYQREIENLQRRITKLTNSLGITEGEIARLRNSPDDVEAGVASLYRDVQGLNVGDVRAELKKDLMSAIFEANLNFKRKSG